jgi:hypothetical protein
MAFDQDRHEFDSNGFMIDKDTGHRVGLEPAPRVSSQDAEWPKWVSVHESHIVRKEASPIPFIDPVTGYRGSNDAPVHVGTPDWPENHVNRDGSVMVLVRDEEEERRALEARQEQEEKKVGPGIDPHVQREVHAEVDQARRTEADEINRRIAEDRAQLEADEARRRTEEEQELFDRNRDAAAKLAAEERARTAKLGTKA